MNVKATEDESLSVEQYREGLERGAVWAKSAGKKQLRRLQTVRDNARLMNDWDLFFGHEDISCVYCAGEIFHHEIEGGDEVNVRPDRDEAAAFWEQLGIPSEDWTDPDFVRGFADGCFQ